MTTASELRALADEIEKLEGPNREMDRRIIRALEPVRIFKGETAVYLKRSRMGGIAIGIPRYSASIDAAAGLMPEGWRMDVSIGVYDGRRCEVRAWSADGGHLATDVVGAATEPLARTAAALRARAAVIEASAAADDVA